MLFVSTDRTALYALHVDDGHCLWSAPGLPSGRFALGPSVSGNYVVLGAGNTIYIYKLRRTIRIPRPPILQRPWWELIGPGPPDPPDPPIGPWPGPGPAELGREG